MSKRNKVVVLVVIALALVLSLVVFPWLGWVLGDRYRFTVVERERISFLLFCGFAIMWLVVISAAALLKSKALFRLHFFYYFAIGVVSLGFFATHMMEVDVVRSTVMIWLFLIFLLPIQGIHYPFSEVAQGDSLHYVIMFIFAAFMNFNRLLAQRAVGYWRRK
ncbi:MAG: hypothetical protein FWC89_00280 [Defluviitaleaceae bacterium]|nr:hypothetical protein [Defluviitaleaceae bacterium]